MSLEEGNWVKRDTLRSIENKIQNQWKIDGNTIISIDNDKPTFFATFPYPYMNGTMHLGHAYTLSRIDFYCRYMKQKGYNVLFPFAFHGTGMPIVACANKLKDALKVIDNLNIETINNLEEKNQIKILWNMKVPIEEIPKFVDPYYWIEYFPKRAKIDLKSFGLSADFTRSFMTTDINPYYDSFVKWQFEILRRKDMVKFGKKYIIYSPKDDQPCADHDRSVGEGVDVKEFTCLKFPVVGKDYSLLVATTRLETFYGLSNIWINPNELYNIFSWDSHEHAGNKYVARFETIRNLRYQFTNEMNKFTIIKEIQGSELVGEFVQNIPIFGTNFLEIIGLPSISINKGTGIVGSVPGHSIFDYKNFIKQRKESDISGVIEVNGNPNYSLDLMKNKLGKKGTKEEDINKEIYREEHNNGKLATGDFIGESCEVARENIKKHIISNDFGFIYCEPGGEVISRSGEKCVVCLTDQWFITYGKEELKNMVNDHIINDMELFDSGVKNQLLEMSNWITDWPCSRSVGLGTKLFDTEYLIDSLSDSTVYMAYYTVAHLINNISSEKLSFDMWEHIFRDGDRVILESTFSPEELDIIDKMKAEFKYWYPLNMQVSGKDLVGNHLVMCLYTHAAIWGKDMLPKSYSINGHALLNGEKQSKNTGNFMTLEETVNKYGSDATRIALAFAGTSFDDANFTEVNASEAIVKLYCEMEYCKELIDKLINVNINDTSELTFWDQVFENDMNKSIRDTENFIDQMNFQQALVCGYYELLNIRDTYRSLCDNKFILPNYNLLLKYLNVHLALINPICPHYAQEIWNYGIERGIFDKSNIIQWPKFNSVSNKIIYLGNCIEMFLRKSRTLFAKTMKLNKKKGIKVSEFTLNATFYSCYSEKEIEIIKLYKKFIDECEDGEDINSRSFVNKVVQCAPTKKERGIYGRYASYVKVNILRFGKEWIDMALDESIDEFELIKEWGPIILIKEWCSNGSIGPVDLKELSNKGKVINFNIVVEKGNEESMKNEYGPGNPNIKII